MFRRFSCWNQTDVGPALFHVLMLRLVVSSSLYWRPVPVLTPDLWPLPPAPSGSGPDELLSSSSIFDHVDRLSRGSSDGNRRQANKVQLIAMQPRPSPPQSVPSPQAPPPQAPSRPSPSLTEKVDKGTKVGRHTAAPFSTEASIMSPQVALRHKSEIEHHRNKLRQRAKRRGQCEFPSMDDIMDAFGDGPVQSEVAQRLYSSAHDHMDCILQADAASPTADSRKRSDFTWWYGGLSTWKPVATKESLFFF